jgi:hypothetical protein
MIRMSHFFILDGVMPAGGKRGAAGGPAHMQEQLDNFRSFGLICIFVLLSYSSVILLMSFAFKFASALRQPHAAVKSGYQRCVGICCQRLCARLSTSASEGVPNRYKIYTKTGTSNRVFLLLLLASFFIPQEMGARAPCSMGSGAPSAMRTSVH